MCLLSQLNAVERVTAFQNFFKSDIVVIKISALGLFKPLQFGLSRLNLLVDTGPKPNKN